MISVKTQMVFLHLAGALMEHFVEGRILQRHWYIDPKLYNVVKYWNELLSAEKITYTTSW